MTSSRALNKIINEKIDEINAVVDLLPGVIIIHSVKNFIVEYMSQNGLDLLGISLEKVRSFSAEEYHQNYFNPEDAGDYVPKIRKLLADNTDETITFFQQVRFAKNEDWIWHMSTMKILMRDDEGFPILSITMAFKIDPMQHITAKVSRMLEENTFLRKNYNQFAKLTNRECDVLRLLVLGNSSLEIGRQLFISVATVETHRKNIKQKLKVNSSFELAQYARAFDLI